MHKPTILVVDDTIANLELLESILDVTSYHVRVATSGKAALRSIEAQVPDLILLDIMMPGIDGYETCRLVKSNPKSADVPIVFLSAKGEAEDRIKAFEAGGVDYLVKPFHIKEVLVRVQTHLAIHQLQHSLKEKIKLIDKHIITSETDLNGLITDVSQALCDISGYTKEELIGKTHGLLRHPDMPDVLYKELWKTILQGKTWIGEIKNKKKNGAFYWVLAMISPKYDANGAITGYSSLRQDITDHKRVQELSITDQLTQLHNRRYFNEVFPLEIKRAIRSGSFLSFIMLDIDYFKRYNDTYGHQAGDDVLERIGLTLKEQFKRPGDFTFRLGGEEFSVVFTTNDCKDAKMIAEGIRAAVEDLCISHEANEASQVVSVSIGVACVDFSQKAHQDMTMDTLYKLADEQLYLAKEAGRNQIALVALD